MLERSDTTYAKIANWDYNPVSKDCFIFLLDSYLFISQSNCHEKAVHSVVDELSRHTVSVDHLELNHFVILHFSDLKSFFIHCDQVTNYTFAASNWWLFEWYSLENQQQPKHSTKQFWLEFYF